MHAIVARLALLALVAEHRVYAKWGICNLQRFCNRQKTDVIKVACTCSRQVRVAESCNGAVGVEITGNPVPTGLSVVGAQLHHSERSLRSWVDIALPVCADEWINQFGVAAVLCSCCNGQQSGEYDGEYLFHSNGVADAKITKISGKKKNEAFASFLMFDYDCFSKWNGSNCESLSTQCGLRIA